MELINNPSLVSLTKWIENDKKELVDGCLRSLPMHHIILSDDYIQKIIAYVSLQKNQNLNFLAIAATPGWPRNLTKDFLEQAMTSDIEDTKKAATAALNGKYLKWSPL
ncbi:hypothetical protein BJAS_P4675 [Bathymodiolus japonicus methanotrophic gill symbiont]|uniref:hypothetical protein n=1 Tax=Bathymodiolus japonicus methanotrophic gill symbiont TaxID=113269 RepID=UPI001B67A08E|nr:hypothetical protein [Bathymodiolus japonicus methanotrophic gill symbiont]GFO73700.1 hypothetical protein BJAS_P4675 [Bathymodiolus japonicus methanotrophic gill symbiont]